MGDVDEGEAKERQVCLVCQRKEIIQKIDLSSLICSLYHLKCHVGSIQRLQHDLACGEGTDDASDCIQVMEATEVPAPSQSQAAHTLGNQELSSWRGDRKLMSCVF